MKLYDAVLRRCMLLCRYKCMNRNGHTRWAAVLQLLLLLAAAACCCYCCCCLLLLPLRYMSSMGCLSLSARDCFSLRKMERSCTKPSCTQNTSRTQTQTQTHTDKHTNTHLQRLQPYPQLLVRHLLRLHLQHARTSHPHPPPPPNQRSHVTPTRQQSHVTQTVTCHTNGHMSQQHAAAASPASGTPGADAAPAPSSAPVTCTCHVHKRCTQAGIAPQPHTHTTQKQSLSLSHKHTHTHLLLLDLRHLPPHLRHLLLEPALHLVHLLHAHKVTCHITSHHMSYHTLVICHI